MNLDDGLVVISGTEQVPLNQARELGRQLLKDPEFDSNLPHLVDLRGLILRRSRQEATVFRDFVLVEYRPKVRASVAVVVDDSLDHQSLAALYHLCCAMERTELFDQYEQALKWLMRKEFA